MNRRTTTKLWIFALAIVVAVGTDAAWGASGTMDLGAPWGDADRTETSRVEVTYQVKASGSVPQSAVDAVQDGIDAWNGAIDEREDANGNTWEFDLVPVDDDSTGSSSGGPPSAHHQEDHDGGPGNEGGHGNGAGKGNSSGNGKGKGSDPDVVIHVKAGGGPIAGTAQRTLDDGFVVGVKIQISGSAFGLENDAETVEEVTMHELGHALALEHHSNDDDLMGETLGYEGGGPSSCDLNGFEQAHEWLTDDVGEDGVYVSAAASIECEGGTSGPETADLEVSKTGPATVSVDETYDYELTTVNHGPDDASNVEIVDTLPEEVTFESVDPAANCGETDGVVTCTFAQLAADQGEDITISVTAPGEPTPEGEPIENVAAVSAEQSDDDSGNNNDNAETEVVQTAQECTDPVDASASEDTCGTVLSVSATGNASSTGGMAVSGTGDASSTAGDESCGASDTDIAAGCVAASGTGDASSQAGDNSCGQSSLGVAVGCVAVSGAGDASNEAGERSCGHARFGGSAGCVAVSGAGDASNDAGADSCGDAGGGAGAGCVAVSGTGDASNEAGDSSCGDPIVGIAVGCVAASGAGDASNTEAGEECEGPRVTTFFGLSCLALTTPLGSETPAPEIPSLPADGPWDPASTPFWFPSSSS